MKMTGWFARVFQVIREGRSVTEEEPETVRVFVPMTTPAGVRVDGDTALKNATVWACITYLSRTVAMLPWRVMQEMPRGGDQRAPWHPVDHLLRRRPNPEMTPMAFKEVMTGYAVRKGNGVAEIQRDARGVPVALWPIHPSRLDFKRDDETGELLYEITDNFGEGRVLRSNQVFHVRGYGEGAVGLDVMTYAAESIGWAQATQLFGASFFGNGAHASGFISVPGKMTPEGKAALEHQLHEKHGGPARAHKTWVLDAGMTFNKNSEPPEAAQFIETRQHQVEEICRWFGVPPHKVMHMLRSTFSNIEHQSIEVVVDSITPWALRFEQEADFKFFGQNRQGFYTKFDLKGLLRGDFKSRQEGLQIMRRNGVVNANEWRQLEEMDEIGPAGDKYICEANMTTLDAVGREGAQGGSSTGVEQVPPGEPQDESPLQRARRQAALLH